MCGIALVFGPGAAGYQSLFNSMLEVMAGRGEVTETYVGDRILAGTRRLKIVDRDHAVQPIFNQARDRLIVFNGEIFNFPEIRAQLASKYQFQTDSDTETILYAYTEYGPGCLDYFEGQFAFAIVDLNTQEVFWARDRLGISPLYYVEQGLDLFIASEIKALVSLGQKIQVLLPGQWRTSSGQTATYFTPKSIEAPIPPLEEYLGNLRRVIGEAVQKRVDTDLPVGIIYSGGLDSSIILSQAVKFHSNVTAFTIGSAQSDDLTIARHFCQEQGIKHVAIPLTKASFHLRHVKRAIAISELSEYGDIINATITVELYQRIHAAGIKVVLGGDCSDELFGGYEMYGLNLNEADIQKLFWYKLANLHRTELQRVDRCGMAYQVETRVPFLDNQVVKLALSTPKQWKVNNGIEKWCLRQAFQGELPSYIIQRKKNPLSHASGLHEWIRMYKVFFAKYYNHQGYGLCEPIKQDFSYTLAKVGYQVDRAIAQTNQDYDRLYLWGELIKAGVRRLIFS